jgi:RNA 3'-terminal phosphate cyclase (ATP)
MIQIDGAAKSGSGTILRSALTLATVLGQPLRMTGIRARRPKPGLRPQHLACVTSCAEMCRARVKGAAVGSMAITYDPTRKILGGRYEWNIGTAGSTTLLLSTLLPVALFADSDTTFSLSGGLFQDFAPSAHHMQHVFLPTLKKMGIEAALEIVQPGYVPSGRGVIRVTVSPLSGPLRPLVLHEQGTVETVRGISLSSHLAQQRVSERMAAECTKVLAEAGFQTRIETVNDDTSLQAGASLTVWAATDSGCLIGSDQAGKRGRSSESIGRNVASRLKEDLATDATVDRHMADQLILYAILGSGTTQYMIPRLTDHVEASMYVAEKWGAGVSIKGNALAVTGLGCTPGAGLS